jgi:hypothetical protein
MVQSAPADPFRSPSVLVLRLAIVVAVKKRLAIWGRALAAFVADADQMWNDPNPAQTWVVFYLDPVLISVVWPGGRPL